jgi:hypothetical protein
MVGCSAVKSHRTIWAAIRQHPPALQEPHQEITFAHLSWALERFGLPCVPSTMSVELMNLYQILWYHIPYLTL